MTANADDTVGILLGTGTGSFGAPTWIGVGRNPQAVAVSDLNGNGHPDLVTANQDDDTVSVLLDVCN